MKVFDIIGPVMIGPSSSHTAGAVRIGNVVHAILGLPEELKITFCGSFAGTYRGHGSDRAIIAGIMGMKTDDKNIVNSLEIAAQIKLPYTIETSGAKVEHPNTIIIKASNSTEKLELVGISLGGGNIKIAKINGISIDFRGNYNTIIIKHQDAPGVISQVTKVLAENMINIASMNVYRSDKKGDAMMFIEIDEDITAEALSKISCLEHIKNTKLIAKIS